MGGLECRRKNMWGWSGEETKNEVEDPATVCKMRSKDRHRDRKSDAAERGETANALQTFLVVCRSRTVDGSEPTVFINGTYGSL